MLLRDGGSPRKHSENTDDNASDTTTTKTAYEEDKSSSTSYSFDSAMDITVSDRENTQLVSPGNHFSLISMLKQPFIVASLVIVFLTGKFRNFDLKIINFLKI